MKKILAIISALITGVLGIAISLTPQVAEAGRDLTNIPAVTSSTQDNNTKSHSCLFYSLLFIYLSFNNTLTRSNITTCSHNKNNNDLSVLLIFKIIDRFLYLLNKIFLRYRLSYDAAWFYFWKHTDNFFCCI